MNLRIWCMVLMMTIFVCHETMSNVPQSIVRSDNWTDGEIKALIATNYLFAYWIHQCSGHLPIIGYTVLNVATILVLDGITAYLLGKQEGKSRIMTMFGSA